MCHQQDISNHSSSCHPPVIAYNERTVVTQTGVADAGQAAASSIGQVVPPVSIFLHESAENLAFRTQGTWDYPAAHGSAIQREANIRAALGFAGGWAGAYVNSTIPK